MGAAWLAQNSWSKSRAEDLPEHLSILMGRTGIHWDCLVLGELLSHQHRRVSNPGGCGTGLAVEEESGCAYLNQQLR